MMSIKMIVEQVFARWATDVAPAWGEGRYTPNDDQFAEMAAEAIQADRAQRSPYGDVSTVAQAKAEALREAAECIVLREDQVGCPSCRVNAEAEAEVWLRDRAAATENSAGCG